MKRQDHDQGYTLIAEEGKELIVLIDGEETARTKSVLIPPEGTLNEWIEVDEKIPEPMPEPTEEELKAQKIAELEAELARLRG